MTTLLFVGLGLGIAIVTSPGAVTAEAIRRGLNHGFTSAFVLQLGALIGLLLWAIIAFMGLSIIAESPIMQAVLGVGGSLLLLYLAWGALRSPRHATNTAADETSSREDFTLGIALSMANPLPLALWLGLGNNITASINDTSNIEAFLVFLTGFLLSALVWAVFFAGILAWCKQYVRPSFFRVINLVSGVLLTAFAIRLLYITIKLL